MIVARLAASVWVTVPNDAVHKEICKVLRYDKRTNASQGVKPSLGLRLKDPPPIVKNLGKA